MDRPKWMRKSSVKLKREYRNALSFDVCTWNQVQEEISECWLSSSSTLGYSGERPFSSFLSQRSGGDGEDSA